ncbi:helix-turn-helix transcriptional regulator [Haladaptatus sp. GCM10026878]|nr:MULTISPECIES: helix-turn-helix domain-containing protein [unclassified Haladaptatus]
MFGVELDDEAGGNATGESASVRGQTGSETVATNDFVEYTYEHSKADFVVETGLTPEELVLELVEENDGRMPQKEVVSLVGWSDATVSRLLQDMEKSKLLNRFRLGREKIICKPELSPGGFDSRLKSETPQGPPRVQEDAKVESD